MEGMDEMVISARTKVSTPGFGNYTLQRIDSSVVLCFPRHRSSLKRQEF